MKCDITPCNNIVVSQDVILHLQSDLQREKFSLVPFVLSFSESSFCSFYTLEIQVCLAWKTLWSDLCLKIL